MSDVCQKIGICHRSPNENISGSILQKTHSKSTSLMLRMGTNEIINYLNQTVSVHEIKF